MPRTSNGSFAPTRDWDALRRAYQSHAGDLSELAALHGIQLATLKSYASRRKWAKPEAADLESRSPTRDLPPDRQAFEPPPVTEIAAKPVLDHLTHVLHRKLQKIEFDMENQTDLSPSDHERHTRALGSITNSLEKVSDLKRADAAGTIDKLSAGAVSAEDDADRLRRELAARIRRLREQLAR